MLSFFRQLAERTESSSSSTFLSSAGLKGELRHRGRLLFLATRLLEVDEHLELVLQDARRIGHRCPPATAPPLVSIVSVSLSLSRSWPSRVFSTR